MTFPLRLDRAATSAVSAAALSALVALAPTGAAARDVPYVPTPEAAVQKMLEMVDAKPDDVLYDLGSGDGRIVIAAIRDFGVKQATGIDIDPQRIEESEANAKAAGVSDRATFLQADLFESDFSDADVVTMYLLSSVNRKLRPRLLDELKPGTRLVSHQFTMDDWKPDAEAVVSGRPLYHWVIPAKVEGAWRAEDGFQAKFAQRFQEVSGTVMAFGREAAIEQGKLQGEKLAFTARGNRDGQPVDLRFEGRVSQDGVIEGRLEGADGAKEVRATRVN